ncbi:hypothetical protein PHYSODRAFT_339878 [Phytophthora sojae]|uniref:Uncharacterized protein n=1 Tax=Phytophthora sojae (strain P6497) TaxID=1094619 RepID=G5A7X4_PHYSP|nr:hypothetical protein PHYSODRAFT_339878 [Phytophthora sojae]EGZ08000.1 hypothetical protein PHYSODRAFT_339878 [Phytophthora sojae]|eukprot:XP_009536172.1 hypothetical protein PHYSODRAFT_339878 [Phytophthora sojae]
MTLLISAHSSPSSPPLHSPFVPVTSNMQVFRFLVIAAIAAMAIDTVASVPEEDSKTAEEVSDNAQDVILGASSSTGSVGAGSTDLSSGSTSGSSVAAAAGIATTAMTVAAVMVI